MGIQIRAFGKNAAQLLYVLNVAFPTWGGLAAAIYFFLLSRGTSIALRRLWMS